MKKSVVKEEPISPTSVMNGSSGKHDHRDKLVIMGKKNKLS